MRMEIKVVANARKNSVEEGKMLTVYVKEKPEANRANMAVIKILSSHFGKQVRIVSGLRSKRKVIEF